MSSTERRHTVCVVGAGVIGLSTAYRLITELTNVDVTLIAEQFTPGTTADNVAGFWKPYCPGDTPEHQIWKWGKETFDHLLSLSYTPEAGALGIFKASGYDIFRNPVPEAFWKDIVFGYRKMTNNELHHFDGAYNFGYTYTTMMCECKTYLPWLRNRFEARGGKCIQRKVDKLTDLAGQYDVIVNCPGVWARYLVDDEQVQPIKGQLIKVDAPWVKHFVNTDDDLYILVGSRSVALGGTAQYGDWTRNIDSKHRQRVWAGCCRLVPSLENAAVVEEWAGLRPGRTSVRIEKEQLQAGNNIIKVVHNYGHGGSGVTLHWGCAGEAVQHVRQLLPTTHVLQSKI